MLLVLPFYSSDEHLAYKNLLWMQSLDKTIDAECILAYDNLTNPTRMTELAERIFRKVYLYSYKPPPNRAWPAASNWVFQHTAWHVRNNFQDCWLWIESDCVPLKSGWFQAIKECHEKGGKPFTGHWNYKTGVWNGVSVYPQNTPEFGIKLMLSQVSKKDGRENPWDVAASKDIFPHLNVANHLFQHVWQDDQTGQAWTFPDIETVYKIVQRGVMLFHRCKDGSLQDRLAGVDTSDTNGYPIFIHGGDVGDLIYGLPVIKHKGGGTLYLNHHSVREPFTEKKVESLLPLLKCQPYLKHIEFSEHPPAGMDFNRFRLFIRKGLSLAQAQLKMFKLPNDAIDTRWLTVDHPVTILDKPVIFHRSARYHNAKFPWPKIVEKYGSRAVFIGLEREHAQFCKAFGKVDWHPAGNFLEAARLIAGAKLFVGNQSAPYSIAEGLKQNAILESCTSALDCQFQRDNVQNDPAGNVVLPEI